MQAECPQATNVLPALPVLAAGARIPLPAVLSVGLVSHANPARTPIEWHGQRLLGVLALAGAMNREAPYLSAWGACH
jgi:hypothetical protein